MAPGPALGKGGKGCAPWWLCPLAGREQHGPRPWEEREPVHGSREPSGTTVQASWVGSFFTFSSGYFQVDPFDSVNHFLECKRVKGKSYFFPILLIARINRHH